MCVINEFHSIVFNSFLCCSVPSKPNKRKLWIEAIEKHQEFNYHISTFSVCESHFPENAINQNGKRTTLYPNVIPTIFPQNKENLAVEFLEEDSSFLKRNAHYLESNFVDQQNISKGNGIESKSVTRNSIDHRDESKEHKKAMLVYSLKTMLKEII